MTTTTKPEISLDGKAALVTGGGGGIGRGAAISLAAAGADVAIIEIVPERCDEMVALIEGMGRKAMAIPANVMDRDAVIAAVDQVAAHFGRLDILVNNAGGVTYRPFAELLPKNWQRHIDMNLVSNLAATSAAIPHLIAAGGGSIIAVTSIEASRAAPGYAVYAACKAGIENLTRTLALELSDHGIRVNAIAPDSTRTPGMSGVFDGSADPARWPAPSPERQDAIRRRIPLARQGVAQECGDLIAFLASPLASYITGAIVPIDGGTWAGGGWIRDRDGKWVLPPDNSPAG
jgi:NAD(P)-dependent dehydrogenase (short-subunit alcohol dehydrogenase family)